MLPNNIMSIKKLFSIVLAFSLSLIVIGCGEDTGIKRYKISDKSASAVNDIPVDVESFEALEEELEKTEVIKNNKVSSFYRTELFNDATDSDDLIEAYLSCKVLAKHDRLKAISLPKDYSSPKEKMSVYYELRPSQEGKKANPSDKTIVYIVGGPIDRISNLSIPAFERYKENGYNLLLIDPRGAGCNYLSDSNQSVAVDSEQLARDIINIINSEGLSNYTIHAHSYGTVLATYVLSLMELEYKDVTKPEIALFEGTVGKALDTYNEWLSFRVGPMNDVLLSHPDIKVLFDKTAKNSDINDIDERYWIAILNGVIAKELDVDTNESLEFILNIAEGAKKDILDKETLDEIKTYSEEFFLELEKFEYSKFEEKLRCEEIVGTLRIDRFSGYIYQNGKIKISKEALGTFSDSCTKYKEKNYFDAKKLKFSTPVLYLHGSKDEKISINSGKYHFSSQKNEKSYFLEVIGEAHEPANYSLNNCLVDLLEAFKSSKSDLDSLKNLVGADGRCL